MVDIEKEKGPFQEAAAKTLGMGPAGMANRFGKEIKTWIVEPKYKGQE